MENKADLTTNKAYLEALTLLRGVAAFLVVVSHSIRASEVRYSASDEESHIFLLELLDLGTYAVFLFFALSGCTLYISSRKHIVRIGDVFPFYIKRVARIWPTFAFSILFYIVFSWIFDEFYPSERTSLIVSQLVRDYNVIDLLSYLMLVFNFTGPHGLLNGAYWSLPVEFQYYLLLPLCLLLASWIRIKWLPPMLFGGALYLVYKLQAFGVGRPELFSMGYSFFGGVLLASYHQHFMHRVSAIFSQLAVVCMLLLVGLVRNGLIVIPNEVPFLSTTQNFYGIAALVTLAIAISAIPPKTRNTAINLMHRYGDVSYSVYLFHIAFIGVAILLISNLGIYGEYVKPLLILVITVPGSYIFSIYTHRYIELPSMEFGRRFSRKMRNIRPEMPG